MRNSRKGKGASNGSLYVIIALFALVLISVGVWWLTRGPEYQFQRAQLDKYIEVTKKQNLLGDGASVYVDMSGGMISAYATPQSQAILQSVINKLAGNNAIEFYGLAQGKISPLNLSHTALYNYMLNPQNYLQQSAPIEKTLAQIVDNRRPALLMTDFEEYKGGMIQQAAYAKRYFIDWLAMGYNITFYKWYFVENGKQKLMFFAVFDDNANRLSSLVQTAVASTGKDIETYVLGSRDFAFPTTTKYISLRQGGNYHNGKGIDAVTAVLENGGKDDYVCYAKPYATATGIPGQFLPLDSYLGTMAEYYPLGVSWADAIANAKQLQEAGVKPENAFTHLFRNLYVDFSAQDGFAVDEVEVRVFDMQETMETIYNAGNNSITQKQLASVNNPEINMVLTASMQTCSILTGGWREICVDFDNQFKGTFMGGIPGTNLIRANIVISKTSPDVDKAMSYFSWDGNASLANSVKEALTAASTNPQGRILFTYYIKTFSE